MPTYERSELTAGMRIPGYAIVEQYDATTVILPGPRGRGRPVAEPADRTGGRRRCTHDRHRIDPITLDLIENALLNARFEMDEVVRRAAMSPTIRVQHDEFPMICNARGQMVVGQFGSYIPEVIDRFGGDIAEGDVILLNDPYLCKGSISHCNDWLVIVPIFHEGEHVGFALDVRAHDGRRRQGARQPGERGDCRSGRRACGSRRSRSSSAASSTRPRSR